MKAFPRVQNPGWRDYFAITPSDTVDFAVPTYGGIYVGGTGGDVQAVREDGTVVKFDAVPVGAVLPIVAIRVNSTDTTATEMVGLA